MKDYSQTTLSFKDKYQDYEYPRVSVIIPTLNCAQSISVTLSHLVTQKYPDFEIIVVDGGSADHTLQIVKNYKHESIHLYILSTNNRYVQINKGITQASGEYVSILFPGDFYVDNRVLKSVMDQALKKDKPHLIYTGTLLRDGRSDPKILFRNLNIHHLIQGQQPTSLQSCWIRKDVFGIIGKFSSNYTMRGGFDLMCRFLLKENLTVSSIRRVTTDFDLRLITRPMIWCHFKETSKIIFHYFGAAYLFKWLLNQKDLKRLISSWWHSVKLAFLGEQ